VEPTRDAFDVSSAKLLDVVLMRSKTFVMGFGVDSRYSQTQEQTQTFKAAT
jgi:hypothetical protein